LESGHASSWWLSLQSSIRVNESMLPMIGDAPERRQPFGRDGSKCPLGALEFVDLDDHLRISG